MIHTNPDFEEMDANPLIRKNITPMILKQKTVISLN